MYLNARDLKEKLDKIPNSALIEIEIKGQKTWAERVLIKDNQDVRIIGVEFQS